MTTNSLEEFRQVQAELESLRHIIHEAMMIVVVDQQGIIQDVNNQFIELTKYPREELIGAQLREMMSPGQPEICDQIQKSLANGEVWRGEWKSRAKDGSSYWVKAVIVPQQHGSEKNYCYFLTDITTQKSAEQQVYMAGQMFDKALEAIMYTDPNGVIQAVNQSFQKMCGYSTEELIGRTPRMLKSDRHGQPFYTHLWDSLLTRGEWKGQIWNRRKNGEIYLESKTIIAIKDERGNIKKFLSFSHDITEYSDQQEYSRHQYYDPLTKLATRSLFLDRLKVSIAESEKEEQLVAIILLDIDRFKDINDSLGFRTGDQLLLRVGQRLKQCLQEKDTVARMGGDEFALLLPKIKEEELHIQTSIILEAFKDPFLINELELFPNISMGISLFPVDGHDAELLIKNAGSALQKAKKNGGATYQLYTEAMNNLSLERLQLESRLRKAIENEELLVYYQPQFNIHTNKIVGVEALVRWQDSERGLIPPNQFIPLAEESRLIIPLGEWVLRTACQQMKKWQLAGYPTIQLSVNLSARQFEQRNLVERVASILEETGLEPRYLDLEITESMAIANLDHAIYIMHELRNLGVNISFDDFGIGYSSLSYLNKFPIQTLKIDRSFIQGIGVDSENEIIINALISLGKSLQLTVIPEGVESEQQLNYLKEQGCGIAQGFLFSAPIPKEEMKELFEQTQKLS